jgi:predicted ABC-type transport system involved in lysophospholipase L1 biosynthesis ATPase subunit
LICDCTAQPIAAQQGTQVESMFDLLREVSGGGATFLIVTHGPRLAARCDQLIELVDGRIQSDQPSAATHNGRHKILE